MSMVYEQNEKMMGTFLQQATWIPEEGRKAIETWMQTYKKGCEDFKKMADENYQKVEEFFAGSED
jgi:hypothetical protein